MPVVSECKLNQVDIVGEPLSTSVQCPAIPLSASFLPSFPFLPSFLPSLSQIVFWIPIIFFFDAYPTFNPLPAFCLTCFVLPFKLATYVSNHMSQPDSKHKPLSPKAKCIQKSEGLTPNAQRPGPWPRRWASGSLFSLLQHPNQYCCTQCHIVKDQPLPQAWKIIVYIYYILYIYKYSVL